MVTETLKHASPVDDREDVDPELLALPDPPRRERTWTATLMIATAVAALLLGFAIRRDVAYALSAPQGTDLGDLASATGALPDNQYVTARGTLGGFGGVRFERPLMHGSFRLLPATGREDVWVEVFVPEGTPAGRFVPPTEFRGRMVRLDDAGPKHRGLAAAVSEQLGHPVPAEARILVRDETPKSARWSVALGVTCVLFAAWNVFAMTRLFRRVT
jgi:hypothetical protein